MIVTVQTIEWIVQPPEKNKKGKRKTPEVNVQKEGRLESPEEPSFIGAAIIQPSSLFLRLALNPSLAPSLPPSLNLRARLFESALDCARGKTLSSVSVSPSGSRIQRGAYTAS